MCTQQVLLLTLMPLLVSMADAQVLLGGAYGAYPYALGAYGYAGLPYGIPFVPLVAHPNGAVVPLEPADVSFNLHIPCPLYISYCYPVQVVKARAEHLTAVAEALAA